MSRKKQPDAPPAALNFLKGQCVVCLCTDEDACPDGCEWTEREHVLCSECAPLVAAFAQYRRQRR